MHKTMPPILCKIFQKSAWLFIVVCYNEYCQKEIPIGKYLEKRIRKKSKGEKTMKNVNTFSGKMLVQAEDLVNLCEKEIERQHEIQENAETRNAKSNCAKQVRKMELMENILMSVPHDL